MAPEVITAEDYNTNYDEKADIWSIGITCIEMAECAPPLYDLHPMRALFMIPKNKAPTLSKKGKWSKDFHDFLTATINKNVKKRSDAKSLLQVCIFQWNSNLFIYLFIFKKILLLLFSIHLCYLPKIQKVLLWN